MKTIIKFLRGLLRRDSLDRIEAPKDLNTAKKLDAVLFYLQDKKCTHLSIRQILFDKGFGCTVEEEQELLNKLISDGLIETVKP